MNISSVGRRDVDHREGCECDWVLVRVVGRDVLKWLRCRQDRSGVSQDNVLRR